MIMKRYWVPFTIVMLLLLGGCQAQPDLPAPRLIERTPAAGAELPVDTPLTLTFDQPMDPSSVESALLITPTLAGEWSWVDERTATFTPAQPPARGARYEVTVGEAARSAVGKALTERAVFDFVVEGDLAVAAVQPAPDTQQLGSDFDVTVVFNRPVVALNTVKAQSDLPVPLIFSPAVKGQGEWVNTSIYVFHPEGGFMPATDYTAQVPAGLVASSGGTLTEDYIWHFSTVPPQVAEIWPPDGYIYFAPGDVISVTFNQWMDHASVEEAFALVVDDRPARGRFGWMVDPKHSEQETMIFTPTLMIARNSHADVKLAVTAHSRFGPAGLNEALSWKFTSIRHAGVVGMTPRSGAKKVNSQWIQFKIEFTSPMDTEVFTQHVTFSPPITNIDLRWESMDRWAMLSFSAIPSVTYEFNLDAAAPDRYGEVIGEAKTVTFTTGPLESSAYLKTGYPTGIFDAAYDTEVFAVAANVSQLDFKLYRTPFPIYLRRLNQGDSLYEYQDSDLLRDWSQELNLPPNSYQIIRNRVTDDDGKQLPPGIYYLEMSTPDAKSYPWNQSSHYFFIKSYINLTLKHSDDELLVWATDLESGKPHAGLPVRLYCNDAALDSGITDDRGLYGIEKKEIGICDGTLRAVSGQPGERDFSITSEFWNLGVSSWNFKVKVEQAKKAYRTALYTDRPIYRPGQTVYFKEIVRGDDDGRYFVPTTSPSFTVMLRDPQYKTIYQETLTLNDMGSAHGEFTLDEEAPVGNYFLFVENVAGTRQQSVPFQVAEYRKPEYQIEITTDRPAYIAGDTIAVEAEAGYYFGGAVGDAQAEWRVYREVYPFNYRCPARMTCLRYEWTDNDRDWTMWYESEEDDLQLVAEGKGRTDAQGRLAFEVPAELGTLTTSQNFIIEVSVIDPSGQEVSRRTVVPVHRGEFYIGAASRGYLAQVGQAQTIDLLAVTPPDGVDGESRPRVGQTLDVVFMERRWYSVKQKAEDDQFYWSWEVEDSPVFTATATTDADGKATAAFIPERAGTYRVRISGRDGRGQTIYTSAYFWVWGGSRYVAWRQQSNNRIELIPDKREYEVGDVAEILIPSPYSRTVQALVTIERGGIYSTVVQTLERNSTVLRIPIVEDYLPNVFVSVVLMQGASQSPDGLASFKMGLIELPISNRAKQLQITLTPDKDMAAGEVYGPRQKATFDVLVTDSEGRPVEAEVSLRLADLAALALADEKDPALVDVFWNQRGLSVWTGLALTLAMERFNRELAPGAKGGGGGEGGLVRSDFADTAYWNATVRTDREGKAQVTVTLPDNLTTWRMQAKAITADAHVGRTDVDIVSTLELLVRPVVPRFFIVGDKVTLATLVHNNSTRDLPVTVRLEADGLALPETTVQTVVVPAHEAMRVTWPVTVPVGKEVRVRMSAQAAGEQAPADAWEDRLPVYRYSTPEVVATSGRLSEAGTRLELINVPQGLDSSQGEMTVKVEGSLTAASQDALDYLKHYPYECTEQTVSRFLPNLVTYRLLEKLGRDDPTLKADLTEQVEVALQRLYSYQHYDGGWGWWVDDKSNTYLTAYALQGLLEAKRSGFAVDSKAQYRGLQYLRENLASPAGTKENWEANRLAYQLYVLGEYLAESPNQAKGELGVAVKLFDERWKLGQYGKAYLARALSLLEPEEPSHVKTLLAELNGAAVLGARGTHWEESMPDVRNMNTDIHTTAVVIWALSKLDPQSETLPQAVRWLMSMREDGRWESTQATSWALMALSAYMDASGELEGDFRYGLELNGKTLGEGAVNAENLAQPQTFTVTIAELLMDEANRLAIQREGDQGQLYYEVGLRTYHWAEEVEPLDRGVMVDRQYSLLSDPGKPITQAAVGDLIQVKLTMIAANDLHYVAMEDPLPAGCEAMDTSLNTTSSRVKAEELARVGQEGWHRGWGWWYFSHTEIRDEKVALFAPYLSRGTYEYTYVIRASMPGRFQVLPATAMEMYFPEIFGRTGGMVFTVVESSGGEVDSRK